MQIPRPHAGLALVMVLAAASGSHGQAPAAGARTTIVLSDLHMGIGRDGSDGWHPYEDFRWAAEFTAFLDALTREGKGAVDLVLNGDTIDFPQAAEQDCSRGPDLGCSDRELLGRLDRVFAAHKTEFEALQRFAQSGSNRVTFVPGDADAALLLPAVKNRLQGAFGARADRVAVASAGSWVSSDGRIHAEHGHQLAWFGHGLPEWPAPIRREGERDHLTRSPGERLTGGLYRTLERKFPLVDNVAMLGAGLKRALSVEGAAVTPELVKHLLLSTISWQQFRMELDDGDVEPPTWVVADVRAQGGAFLLSSLPDDDPIRALVADWLKGQDLDQVARAMSAMSDDEIVMLCDYRAAVRRARRRFEPGVSQFAPRGPVIAECPRTPETRGGLFDYFWRARDRAYAGYIDEVQRRLPGGAHPAVFVLGHTHLPDRAQDRANAISGGLLTIAMEGFSPRRGAVTPIVINDGAWQRTVTPVQLERRLADRALSSLVPEDLTPCYSFVEIAPYTDAPSPHIRFWRQDRSGTWGMGGDCN